VPRPAKNAVISKQELGQRVRALREARGMSQTAVARALGATQSNVSEMERGVRGMTIHQVTKLAHVLDTSTDAILVGDRASSTRMALASVRVMRRVRRIQQLSEPRQRAVLKVLDALLDQERR
jgi:transcriptional regulator with XRE-family HTH domain